jgi:hypothetical protein
MGGRAGSRPHTLTTEGGGGSWLGVSGSSDGGTDAWSAGVAFVGGPRECIADRRSVRGVFRCEVENRVTSEWTFCDKRG